MSGLISSVSTAVDQRNASPHGDAVGRDKIVMHVSERRTQIEGWLDRLAEERRNDPRARHLVDSLQYYFQPFPYDSIVGLEAKLDHAGRTAQKRAALRKKEAFSMLLEEWKSFPAAQEIIAYFLSQIDACFDAEVSHLLGTATPVEIDSIIKAKIIEPVLSEMSCGPFMLNYNHVAGMVYWLAEQCYIRWHT